MKAGRAARRGEPARLHDRGARIDGHPFGPRQVLPERHVRGAAVVLDADRAPRALDRSVGLRPSNRGAIDVGTDPGRSVIERVTNAIDALLGLEHTVHKGKPECKSPRDAAEAWLGLDRRGLGSTTPRARQALARRTVVQLEPGEGKDSRIVTVRDSGIGLSAEEMPRTILSLNEGNKWQ